MVYALPVEGFLIGFAGIVGIGGRYCSGVVSFEGVAEGVVGVFGLGHVVFGAVVEGVALIDFIRVLLWLVVGHGVVGLFGLHAGRSTWVWLRSTTLYRSGEGYCLWNLSRKVSR